MIERYFKHPILFDYLFALLASTLFAFFYCKDKITLPSSESALTTTTDLSTIALTLAGFVLTLLTVLITFKTGARIPNGNNNEELPLFDLFFSTNLYYKTTEQLKWNIASLIFVALIGFSLKIFLTEPLTKYISFWNLLGLIIIITTLSRSLMILTKIVALQKDNQ